MTVKTLRNLNAAVLVVAMAGTMTCGRRSNLSECKSGDLAGSLNAGAAKLLRGELGPWVKHVRECHVGEYVIDVPAEGGHGEIMVGRNGQPMFFVTASSTILFDSSGKRVLFEANQGQAVGFPVVSYATHNRAADTWVENVDFGADGTVEYRTTETAGGTIKKEFSLDQRWLEVIQRGDRSGVIFDGEFMTADAARQRLAAKQKSEAGK